MKAIAPYCPLPITNPARAYVSSHDTDIRRTLEEHAPIYVSNAYGDDYDDVERTAYLEQFGSFK